MRVRTRLVEFVIVPIPLLEGAELGIVVVDELVKVVRLLIGRDLLVSRYVEDGHGIIGFINVRNVRSRVP